MINVEKINKIDEKLSILLDKMPYNEYVDFIRSKAELKAFDDLLGRVDNGIYPEKFTVMLTDNVLDQLDVIVSNKLKELGL